MCVAGEALHEASISEHALLRCTLNAKHCCDNRFVFHSASNFSTAFFFILLVIWHATRDEYC
jgi:hypothetical protein